MLLLAGVRCGTGHDSLKKMQTAYIGMGGNLASWAGPPEATLAAAAKRLETLGRVICRSSLYSTEPVGFAEQPRFVNAAVALETELDPRELLNALLKIEQEFGRDRSAGFANGPRTLDLDILLFGDLKIDEPDLQIPHPRMAERGFVLVPLREVESLMGDAAGSRSVSQLLQSLEKCAEGDQDAVVPMESDIWSSGACRTGT
jgi:2-amino-4-hydroxy-6-hydroxymethyldihydropteridine diphosphokinase